MLPASFNRPRSDAGFNLIEAAIVLGIVGLIVGGIWAAASSAYENMRQQSASKQLLSLVQNIRGFYAQGPIDVIDNNLTNLYNLGLLPSDMVIQNGTAFYLRHPWGGNVSIEDGGINGYSSFRVTFQDMKVDVCRNFLSRNANAARGSGLLVVSNGTAEVLNLISNSSDVVNSVQCGTSNGQAPYFIFSLRG
jgi:type II secretory pathway pseudopilin PulG